MSPDSQRDANGYIKQKLLKSFHPNVQRLQPVRVRTRTERLCISPILDVMKTKQFLKSVLRIRDSVLF